MDARAHLGDSVDVDYDDDSPSSSMTSMTGQIFRFMLPPNRLGTSHNSLGSFRTSLAALARTARCADAPPSGAATPACTARVSSAPKRQTKEYTLIVVTTHDVQRVLLGLKHRGFGAGLYNSFGGKVEPGESLPESAQRELREETGIVLDLERMKNSHLGTLFFTFEDSATEMVAHVFHVRIRTTGREGSEGSKGILEGVGSLPKLDRVAAQGTGSAGCDREGSGCGSSGVEFPYVDPDSIRGCDEITPSWFETRDIPLHNMFADDSVWLTRLLSRVQQQQQQQQQDCRVSPHQRSALALDGWFHFAPGGAEVNTVLHHHLDLRPRSSNEEDCSIRRQPDLEQAKRGAFGGRNSASTCGRDARHQPLTLEKRLFHELHRSGVNSPRPKEYNEAYAFVNALRLSAKNINVELVLDVAGGHGALGALFLITTPTVRRAVVIDPAVVGNGGVERAWRPYWTSTNPDNPTKDLRYRHECLRTGLPSELDHAIAVENVDPAKILVVACHACQHLSEEILHTSLRYGVQVAVMPCCQRDSTQGCNWKAASKNLGLPIPVTMDLLLAGKAMSWGVGSKAGVAYDVRLKTINSRITPQNRIIFCRPYGLGQGALGLSTKQRAYERLEQAYKKAHKNANGAPQIVLEPFSTYPLTQRTRWLPCWRSLSVGFVSGVASCLILYVYRDR
jgi:8-oxo-dGTP pyrophosphatase MutT (NUDIX family)